MFINRPVDNRYKNVFIGFMYKLQCYFNIKMRFSDYVSSFFFKKKVVPGNFRLA